MATLRVDEGSGTPSTAGGPPPSKREAVYVPSSLRRVVCVSIPGGVKNGSINSHPSTNNLSVIFPRTYSS